MRKLLIVGAALMLGLMGAGSARAAGFTVSSSDVKNNSKIKDEQVFNGFGCTGGNISPELHWKGAPAGTKSFAVTVYDPDAPTGSGFWHWVVFNIPATANSLPKNAGDLKSNLAPQGSVQSRTDFGVPGWGGPCPPPGSKPHHYIFKVIALDVDHLEANADTSAAVVGFMMHFHTKGTAKLVGLYNRK